MRQAERNPDARGAEHASLVLIDRLGFDRNHCVEDVRVCLDQGARSGSYQRTVEKVFFDGRSLPFCRPQAREMTAVGQTYTDLVEPHCLSPRAKGMVETGCVRDDPRPREIASVENTRRHGGKFDHVHNRSMTPGGWAVAPTAGLFMVLTNAN
jgi:hypothetical protein